MVALVTKQVIVRGTPVLVPATPRDLGILVKQHRNVPLNTILRGAHRSRKQENFYRALVRLVAEGLGADPDTLHAEIKYRTGKVTQVVDSPVFGRAVQLKSAADMDDSEFNAFVTTAVDVIFSEYLPNVDRKSVIAEAERMAAS